MANMPTVSPEPDIRVSLRFPEYGKMNDMDADMHNCRIPDTIASWYEFLKKVLVSIAFIMYVDKVKPPESMENESNTVVMKMGLYSSRGKNIRVILSQFRNECVSKLGESSDERKSVSENSSPR